MNDVGERLKQLRTGCDLSQRELAKLAGTTNSTISAIEKNSVSPSVSSLKKLLDAINISLSDFFSMEVEEEMEKKPKKFFSAASMKEVGTGGVSRIMMGQAIPDQSMLLMDETFPPGTSTGELISHEGEETGFIVSGEIEITVGEEIKTLTTGDGFQFNSEQPHYFNNRSDKPCRIICCATPAKF